MEFKKYVLIRLEEASKGVRSFFFEPVDENNISFKAGQFVKIYDSERKMFRPYSIASSSNTKGLEFLIKLVGGSFTTYLSTLKKGDHVWIEGPLGHFYYNNEEKSAFVCGGIGIAPMLGMIREINSLGKTGDHVLFYSAKTQGELACFDEINALTAKNKSIRAVFTLTQETPNDWKGESGRVNEEMINDNVSAPLEYNWYICGPLKMAQGIRDTLLAMGVSQEKIKLEGWG